MSKYQSIKTLNYKIIKLQKHQTIQVSNYESMKLKKFHQIMKGLRFEQIASNLKYVKNPAPEFRHMFHEAREMIKLFNTNMAKKIHPRSLC